MSDKLMSDYLHGYYLEVPRGRIPNVSTPPIFLSSISSRHGVVVRSKATPREAGLPVALHVNKTPLAESTLSK